jgi:integrase
MTTLDLFGTPDAADRRLLLAAVFDRWITGKTGYGALRDESVEVYRDMWGVFVAWCVDRDALPSSVTQSELSAFLQSLGRNGPASKRYVLRMARLLERVELFDASQAARAPNPAYTELRTSPGIRLSDSEAEVPLPSFLTAREAKAVIDFVTQRQVAPAAQEAWPWNEVRDRTSVAIQLGAGVTPGEARALTLEQVIIEGGRVKGEPWALSLPGNGKFAARQTPVSSWAGRQLGAWLLLRERIGIAGPYVFPSTRAGRAWSKPSATNACRSVLERAGIADPAGGSFKLRHTFALRQLTRHPSADVAKWLGVQDAGVMERYQRVLLAPVDLI